jgi:hypothetical protein
MIVGSSKQQDAVDQVLARLYRYGLTLDELGGEDQLHASHPRLAEKLRRIERVWALMAKLGIVFSDLEDAEPYLPAKPVRRRRGERVSPQVIEPINELRKSTTIEIIEEFRVSEVCAPEIASEAAE